MWPPSQMHVSRCFPLTVTSLVNNYQKLVCASSLVLHGLEERTSGPTVASTRKTQKTSPDQLRVGIIDVRHGI